MDEIAAELLPEDKFAFVSWLTAARHNVVMVGDGVNDAPALMKATVGVAMGAGWLGRGLAPCSLGAA